MSSRAVDRAPASGIPGRIAAPLGLLAVGAALAAGQLVAGVLAPASAPFVAVGDAVIRLSPQPLTEFAKQTFGTADKAVLLAGMAVVIGAAAAGAGLAARHRERPGVLVITGLGVLGFAAVLTGPSVAPIDLLAPAVALGTGIGVFRPLHRLARVEPAGGEPPAGPVGSAGPAGSAGSAGPSRRRVLVGWATGIGLLSLAGGAVGVLLGGRTQGSRQAAAERLARVPVAGPAPPIPAGADFPAAGTPPFRTPNPDFYRIDTALRVPALTAEDWTLRLHGLVDRELTLSYPDLLARPLVARTMTLTCVSNPVGGDLISTATFLGVELRDLLLEAGVRDGADQLLSTSGDGWTAGTPIDVLLEPDRGALLAVAMNDEPLPAEHGFPVRMVVPGLYGYVSATKWLTELEVTTFDAAAAYWVQRGWAVRAPIKTQSRIDRPRRNDSVPAGRLTAAGIAWAQHTGITRVEVRLDDGPWRPAELATEVNQDCWRLWRVDLEVPAGEHTVQSRATDRTGRPQTETPADVVPDGATGWPTVRFTAG